MNTIINDIIVRIRTYLAENQADLERTFADNLYTFKEFKQAVNASPADFKQITSALIQCIDLTLEVFEHYYALKNMTGPTIVTQINQLTAYRLNPMQYFIADMMACIFHADGHRRNKNMALQPEANIHFTPHDNDDMSNEILLNYSKDRLQDILDCQDDPERLNALSTLFNNCEFGDNYDDLYKAIICIIDNKYTSSASFEVVNVDRARKTNIQMLYHILNIIIYSSERDAIQLIELLEENKDNIRITKNNFFFNAIASFNQQKWQFSEEFMQSFANVCNKVIHVEARKRLAKLKLYKMLELPNTDETEESSTSAATQTAPNLILAESLKATDVTRGLACASEEEAREIITLAQAHEFNDELTEAFVDGFESLFPTVIARIKDSLPTTDQCFSYITLRYRAPSKNIDTELTSINKLIEWTANAFTPTYVKELADRLFKILCAKSITPAQLQQTIQTLSTLAVHMGQQHAELLTQLQNILLHRFVPQAIDNDTAIHLLDVFKPLPGAHGFWQDIIRFSTQTDMSPEQCRELLTSSQLSGEVKLRCLYHAATQHKLKLSYEEKLCLFENDLEAWPDNAYGTKLYRHYLAQQDIVQLTECIIHALALPHSHSDQYLHYEQEIKSWQERLTNLQKYVAANDATTTDPYPAHCLTFHSLLENKNIADLLEFIQVETAEHIIKSLLHYPLELTRVIDKFNHINKDMTEMTRERHFLILLTLCSIRLDLPQTDHNRSNIQEATEHLLKRIVAADRNRTHFSEDSAVHLDVYLLRQLTNILQHPDTTVTELGVAKQIQHLLVKLYQQIFNEYSTDLSHHLDAESAYDNIFHYFNDYIDILCKQTSFTRWRFLVDALTSYSKLNINFTRIPNEIADKIADFYVRCRQAGIAIPLDSLCLSTNNSDSGKVSAATAILKLHCLDKAIEAELPLARQQYLHTLIKCFDDFNQIKSPAVLEPTLTATAGNSEAVSSNSQDVSAECVNYARQYVINLFATKIKGQFSDTELADPATAQDLQRFETRLKHSILEYYAESNTKDFEPSLIQLLQLHLSITDIADVFTPTQVQEDSASARTAKYSIQSRNQILYSLCSLLPEAALHTHNENNIYRQIRMQRQQVPQLVEQSEHVSADLSITLHKYLTEELTLDWAEIEAESDQLSLADLLLIRMVNATVYTKLMSGYLPITAQDSESADSLIESKQEQAESAPRNVLDNDKVSSSPARVGLLSFAVAFNDLALLQAALFFYDDEKTVPFHANELGEVLLLAYSKDCHELFAYILSNVVVPRDTLTMVFKTIFQQFSEQACNTLRTFNVNAELKKLWPFTQSLVQQGTQATGLGYSSEQLLSYAIIIRDPSKVAELLSHGSPPYYCVPSSSQQANLSEYRNVLLPLTLAAMPLKAYGQEIKSTDDITRLEAQARDIADQLLTFGAIQIFEPEAAIQLGKMQMSMLGSLKRDLQINENSQEFKSLASATTREYFHLIPRFFHLFFSKANAKADTETLNKLYKQDSSLFNTLIMATLRGRNKYPIMYLYKNIAALTKFSEIKQGIYVRLQEFCRELASEVRLAPRHAEQPEALIRDICRKHYNAKLTWFIKALTTSLQTVTEISRMTPEIYMELAKIYQHGLSGIEANPAIAIAFYQNANFLLAGECRSPQRALTETYSARQANAMTNQIDSIDSLKEKCNKAINQLTSETLQAIADCVMQNRTQIVFYDSIVKIWPDIAQCISDKQSPREAFKNPKAMLDTYSSLKGFLHAKVKEEKSQRGVSRLISGFSQLANSKRISAETLLNRYFAPCVFDEDIDNAFEEYQREQNRELRKFEKV